MHSAITQKTNIWIHTVLSFGKKL